MAKTNPTDKNEPRFEIKKRLPKEKPNFFQNIPSFEHPLAEILKNNPVLDSQRDSSGYPVSESLDSQNAEVLDSQTRESLAIQNENTGNPNKLTSDSQITKNGNPKTEFLEIQKDDNSYPSSQNLDSIISKPGSRIAKKGKISDSKISKTENLDSQKQIEKTDWSKYDGKRKAKGILLRTNDTITKEFKQFCIKNDWNFTQGTEIAWSKLMSDLDIQTDTDLDSKIAHDDRRLRLIYKTKPSIINLYLAYNLIFNSKTRWTVRDDDAASKFNECDIRLIELGLIQTQSNKNFAGKINSFSYYVNEIQNFLEINMPEEGIEMMLSINRKRWEQATGKKISVSN